MNQPFKSLLRSVISYTVKERRILGGPFRGKRIITSWHDYPAAVLGRTERPLLDWFEKNVGSSQTWLDVGAHYGYTAIALSRLVGPSGRVFAFEPMLSTAGYLSQTRRINHFHQLTVLPIVLSAPLSLELRQLPNVRGMVDSIIQRQEWNETILLAPLDWLWLQICGDQKQIDGIKIDVQGMKVEVLRGMSELLKAFRPKLVVEVHPGVDRNELLDLLESVGYSAFGVPIEPIGGETEPKFIDNRSYAFHAA